MPSRRTRSRAAAALAVALVAAGPVVAARLAVLPVSRGTSESTISARVNDALSERLAARFALVEPQPTRDAMRRLRLRAPEAAGADELARLAAELGADLLATASVHDADDGLVPELVLSLRLYDGPSGRLVWSAFHGRSGVDTGRWLGRGTIESLDALVPVAVSELLDGLVDRPLVAALGPAPETGRRVAIVPLTSTVEPLGIEISQAATEALRAFLFEHGVGIAEPGCVRAGLRGQSGAVWGELAAEARQAIAAACDVSLLVTGAVERWDRVSASGGVPEPGVALALRLLDAETGLILWMDAREASGFDRSGPFGAGRTYSRGGLLEHLTTRLGERLLDSPGGEPLTEDRR